MQRRILEDCRKARVLGEWVCEDFLCICPLDSRDGIGSVSDGPKQNFLDELFDSWCCFRKAARSQPLI